MLIENTIGLNSSELKGVQIICELHQITVSYLDWSIWHCQTQNKCFIIWVSFALCICYLYVHCAL